MVSQQKVAEFAGPDAPSWAKRRGWRLAVYSRSLTVVMASIFLASWVAQSIAGRSANNEEQLGQLEDSVSWLGYVSSADFWSRTLQNWESEFLAVAAMAVFAVYLRQRGSPESKPVGTPHTSTGTEDQARAGDGARLERLATARSDAPDGPHPSRSAPVRNSSMVVIKTIRESARRYSCPSPSSCR